MVIENETIHIIHFSNVSKVFIILIADLRSRQILPINDMVV